MGTSDNTALAESGTGTNSFRNDFGKAIETLWEAYRLRPHRNEALRAIAFYCTAVADATPYPHDEGHLVMRNCYRV